MHFSAMCRGYAHLWDTCTVQKNADIIIKQILARRSEYKAVQDELGVPIIFTAPVHYRESSLSFKGALCNGDPIIGTERKTWHVPAGRGPFKTWHESAIDEFHRRNLDDIAADKWTIERVLFEQESYNGEGYLRHGVNSSYVWAATNHQQRGLYVADHEWDNNAIDHRFGTAAIIKALAGADSECREQASLRELF